MHDLVARSGALHERVLAFVRRTASLAVQPDGRVCEGGEVDEAFEAIAVDIARFQAEFSPASARLLRARGLGVGQLRRSVDIPAVPTDAFKLTRVAVHPSSLDARVFRTSGTTQGVRGEHAMRVTTTYEAIALAWGRRLLWPEGERAAPVTVVIAPPPTEASDSSLGFMCELFGARWSGGASFVLPGGRLDDGALGGAIEAAWRAERPVLLLATSFALVHLIDGRGGRSLALPAGSVVMQTGGTKGRSREVSAAELGAAAADVFGVARGAVVSEYGMTELTSQAYEVARPSSDGARARLVGPGGSGVLQMPPWARVSAVDPSTLEPVARGEVGLARVVDLGNVDSAVAVQTQDLVREVDGGFELLGRSPGAPPRGCSLAIEELLEARSPGARGE